jgi:SulP family sulfate permease
LLLAVILFVVGYSRVDVVRHEISGATFHSRVVRSREEERWIRQHGDEIYILQLQGFIFFGTADSLFDRVRRRLYDGVLPRPLAVVLDFEHVPGLDSTAVISFGKMKRLAGAYDLNLVLCGVADRVRRQLVRGGLDEADADQLLPTGSDAASARSDVGVLRYFDGIDHGLAWCEGRLLKRLITDEELVAESTAELLPLFIRQVASVLDSDTAQDATIKTMIAYFERLDVEEGTVFIVQGEPADSLYFLAAGRVTARLNMPDGSAIRLETVGSGRIIGEIGFFLGGERTADVLTDEPSTLFRLTRQDLARMAAENPQAASLLHRLVANLLAERVIQLTNAVRALER